MSVVRYLSEKVIYKFNERYLSRFTDRDNSIHIFMNTEKVSRNTHTETDNSTYIDMYQEISTSVYRKSLSIHSENIGKNLERILLSKKIDLFCICES